MKRSFSTYSLILPAILLLFACGGKKQAPVAALEVPVTTVVQQDVRLES